MRVGRPKSRTETSSVRKPVYFKPSEWEELLTHAPPGVRPGTFIHDTVMKEVQALASLSTPSLELVTQSTEAQQYAQNPHVIAFPLSQPIYQRLAEMAKAIGFIHPSDLIRDIAMRAARDLETTTDFLFGEIQEDAIKAALAKKKQKESEKQTRSQPLKSVRKL